MVEIKVTKTKRMDEPVDPQIGTGQKLGKNRIIKPVHQKYIKYSIFFNFKYSCASM